MNSASQSCSQLSLSTSSSSPRSQSEAPSSPSVAAAAAAADERRERNKTRGYRLPSISADARVPRIRLTEEEQARYDKALGRLLYRTAREYVANAAPGATVDTHRWTELRKGSSMTMYKGVRTSKSRLSQMLGIGKTDGSLEDVMDGVYSDSSADLCTVFSFVKSDCTIGKLLDARETRTPDDPFTFAGIKWIVTKMPGGADDRDVLCYERQGLTFDAQGHEVGIHLMHSVDRPEWPANAFKGILRAHNSVCYLHRRCGSRVETFFYGEVINSGHIPRVIVDYATAGKWMAVATALRCSEAKKLSQLRQSVSAAARSSSCSITLSDIDHCDLCDERRGLFSAQQLCGCCQQNVCRSCSVEKELFELDSARNRPLRDRFCKRCLTHVAKQRGSTIQWDAKRTPAPPLPVYFDYALLMATKHPAKNSRSASSSSASSSSSTPQPVDSVIDTTCLEESMRRLDTDSPRADDHDEASIRRRRRFVERLSRRSYTKEQFLADLGIELDVELGSE